MRVNRHFRRLAVILLLATIFGQSPATAKASYASKMEIGNLLFFNGDVDRAIRAFEEAAELNPKALQPHTSLLNLYVQKGTPEAMQRAMSECQEILDRKPGSKDVHLLLGNLLRNQAVGDTNADRQKKEFASALKEIETAEALGVSKATCEYSMATAYLQEGDLDLAYAHITEALKEDPNLADAHLIHAVLTYKRLNSADTKGATTESKPAAGDRKGASAGNDAQALADKASAIGQDAAKPTVVGVLAELDLAIKEKGTNAEAHNTKAEILLSTGDPMQAAAEYRKALLDDPHYLQSLIGIGSCLAQLATKELDPDKAKDYIRQARDAFERAKQIKPDDKNIVYALAVTLERLGLCQEAIQEFRHDLALESDPLTRATIALHMQQLQQGAGLELNVSGALGGVDSSPSRNVGNELFTSGALAIPFKNLIQLPDAKK